jgi:hypothetical protein
VSVRLLGRVREKQCQEYSIQQLDSTDIPGADDAKRVWRRPDWVPAEAESPALATRGKVEVEKRALVRFALFTALRERRVAPREVSIVLGGGDNKNERGQLRRKAVKFGKEIRTVGESGIQTQSQLRRHPAQPVKVGKIEAKS